MIDTFSMYALNIGPGLLSRVFVITVLVRVSIS